MGQSGGHPADGLPGGDPAALDPGVLGDSRGVDEELLDVVVGLGLQAGHGGGADHDAVDGGGGRAVGLGPAAGEVVGRAGGRADAAADDKDHVGHGADGVVGGQEHGVQVLPRVVATGVPVLDLDDDGAVGHGPSNGQDLTDLVHGAGLEGDVGEALGVEALEQSGGLLELGDPGGDGDAVDGGATGAGLGQQALGPQVQVPQVAVHEHGVEGRGAPGLERLLQALEVLGQDGGGGLAPTGELGPVAGVGGGRHDGGIHGGGCHSRQEHRAATGQAGEGGVQGEAAVGQAGDARGEAGAVDTGVGGCAGAVEVVNGLGDPCGHDGGSGTGHDALGETDQDVARSQVQDGAHRGGRSDPEGLGDQAGPVDRVDEHGGGQLAGELLVEAAGGRPDGDVIDGTGEQRGVEGDRGGEELGDRGQDGTAAAAVLTGLGAAGGGRLQRGDDALEIGRAPREDVRLTAVGHAHGDPLRAGDPGQDGVEHAAGDTADREHGGGLPHRAQVEAAGGAGGRGADEAGDGVNLDDALALTGLHGLKQADTQNALGVTDGAHRGVGGRVDAGAGQGGQGRVLGHEDAGHGDVGAVGGGAVLGRDRGGLVVQEPRAARGYGEQIGGNGGQALGHGPVDRHDVIGQDVVQGDQVGQRLAPGRGLASEGDDVGLASAQALSDGGRGAGGLRVRVHGRGVLRCGDGVVGGLGTVTGTEVG